MSESASAFMSVGRQRRLLAYAKPHWRAIVVLTATMGLDVGLNLLKPWPLKLVIDNVLGHRPTPHFLVSVLPGSATPHGLLLWAAIGTVLVFLLSTASTTFYNYFSLRIGQRMVFELASDLFSHLQRLSLVFHSRRALGDTIQRVTGDSYCVSTLVTDALIPAVQALVLLGAMFVVMWSLEPTLTLVALSVLPFLAVVIGYLARPIKDRARESRDYEGKLTSVVEQTLGAVPAVQAFTREKIEEQRFRHYADRTVLAYLRSTLAGIWFEVFSGIVTTIGTAAVIYLGADLALRGKLTAGTIIVFLSYLGSLYEPLDQLTSTASTIQNAAASADRAMEVLETEPDIKDRPGAIEARIAGPIRYEHVSFGYEAGRKALDDVSLEANPGDVVAIVGETGAGKTTLANLLVRFYDPSEGRITIGGKDIRDFQHRSLRQQIALVLQDPFIFPLTIRENIAYGRPDASHEQIIEAAKAAGAHEFIQRLPEGYDSQIGERGATLSGGEKQRLSIARAFLKDAPVLILDEPTSALDARTESALLEAMDRLTEGRITFVIAHRLSTTRRATQILVLHHGQVIERGTHDELVERRGAYADLYGAQAQSNSRAPAAQRSNGHRSSVAQRNGQRPLRIAQIATVGAPVKRGSGESIEHLVALLCDELVERGHDVTLFATGDSDTRARLRSIFPRGYNFDDGLWDYALNEQLNASNAYAQAGKFDIVHSHTSHGLPFARFVNTPTVHTQHIAMEPSVIDEYQRLGGIHVIAPSEHQRRALNGRPNVELIPHGIDTSAFPFGSGGDYLLFLGRIIRDKGPLQAIEIAREAGMPLVLAGPRNGEDEGFFEESIAPMIDDHQISYVGAVQPATRDSLMAGAGALVYPLMYPEPFGLVPVEAMSCGTPVLGTRVGAVPELVEPELTGQLADSWEELPALLPSVLELDRRVVRARAVERFDYRRMVDRHEALYRRLADRGSGS